jgi:tellurite resistance protein TerC
VVLVWIGFLIFVFVLLALDLGVFHRKAHVVSVREALTWTVVWIATALAFSGFVYFGYEHHWLGLGLEPDPVDRSAAYPDGRVNDARSALLKFLTGYIVELSLSADNVFVMAMLFSYFAIPRMYQHRVLFWGILGALAMRGAMIAIGARLVAEFAWILPLFGVVLIVTAARMAFMGMEHGDPGHNVIVRLMRRFLPVTNEFHGEHFFVRTATTGEEVTQTRWRGAWLLTPLVPALVMVETTDLVFAVDSIPAIFAITGDPFLVFTSNVFAILGLRSLYFALAGALHVFRYLQPALALVLLTVGVKMLAHSWFERVLGPDFNLYLLAAVLGILGTGVIVSLIELRWNDPIGRAAKRTVRTLQAWIVPDHLVRTIAREGRRSLSRNRVAAAERLRARRWRARRSVLARFAPKLFGGKGTNLPLVLVHGLLEEGEKYVAFL